MAKTSRPNPPPAVPEAGATLHGSLRLVRMYLGTACFLSGAAMMIIEIAAYRLLAPYFGNSVYTWTALIGVVLISFSAGGFLGGWLAERRLALDLLGWLFAGAAVLTFFVPALHSLFAVRLAAGDYITGAVVASLMWFAVPGALLGAVSPAAVRFYSLTGKDTHVGIAAGMVSMLGSLGSFVGTFLSGFWLLGNFGVRVIFLGTAVMLVVLSVLGFVLAGNRLKQLAPVLLSALLAAFIGGMAEEKRDKDVIHMEESFYHRIEVSERGQSPHKQRTLRLDSTVEGGMNPDDGSLFLEYQNFWRLAMLKDNPKIASALFIGAGAFGMPEELSREFPDAVVDVAEIDPKVIEVGRRFFKLDEHPQVVAHGMDARRFLRTSGSRRWDLIFGDAYNGIRAIPAHLTTQEFFQSIEDHLTPDGLFVMNVISSVQGERAQLLAGILATLRSVFPHVEAFALAGPRNQPQNVILMAGAQDLLPLIKDRFYAPGSWQHRLVTRHVPPHQLPAGGEVFTDDYNPVDAIIARGLLGS